MESFLRTIPKAELHLHIEGTLEPELMFALARRNGIDLRWDSVDELRAAYRFADLQSFLDIYYEGTRVLRTARDFHDLTAAYFRRAAADRVRHAEIFFDPQAHTARGVPFDVVVEGLLEACDDARRDLDLSSCLILCFLRDRSAASALETLEAALPYRDRIVAVGLDSAELGNPPEKFVEVFDRARAEGFLTVAHAGEEGPPHYIRQALDLLHARRVDHGVRCLEDPELVDRLRRERVPLTVCPLSNVRLRVFETLAHHNLGSLLDAGLCVTVNSDDPAYFGGYISDNFVAAWQALELEAEAAVGVVRNAFEASFVGERRRQQLLGELESFLGSRPPPRA